MVALEALAKGATLCSSFPPPTAIFRCSGAIKLELEHVPGELPATLGKSPALPEKSQEATPSTSLPRTMAGSQNNGIVVPFE